MFSVPSGHYEFNKMTFGLSKSPLSFQRLKDIVLKDLVGTECWVFIDDDNYIFPGRYKNMHRDWKIYYRSLTRLTCSYTPASASSHSLR